MEKKKRTVISVEIDQVLVVRRRAGSAAAWCAACGEAARMVTPEEAAALTAVSARAIYRRVEAGRVHFSESPAGVLRICLNSLLGRG